MTAAFRSWLLLLLASLCLLATFFSACNDCKRDSECPDGFRCGPGLRCIGRCIPGSPDDCAPGFLCSPQGDRCIPGSPADTSEISPAS